jgi:N-acyl-D-amino-acid deacylase
MKMLHPHRGPRSSLLALAAAVLCGLAWLDPARAEAPPVEVHGVNAASLRAWLDRLAKTGHRLALVNGFATRDGPRFAALAVRDPHNSPWLARLDLTPQQYQKAFTEWAAKGYRLLSVSGYPNGQTTRFAALWVRDPAAGTWAGRHGLTAREYGKAVVENDRKHMRPVYVAGYPSGESYRFAAIFSPTNLRSAARHDLTGCQYHKACASMRARGFRPVSVSGYLAGDTTRFAVAFVRDNSVASWATRYRLSPREYERERDRRAKRGYRLLTVSGYPSGRHVRYVAVWVKDRPGTLPVSGTAVPSLAGFDRAMQEFMQERGIPGGTLAVMKNGRLVLARGYGFADPERTRVIAPDTPFRIASLTKPITAAATRQLIRAGKLRFTTKVFPLLGVTPPQGQQPDPRLKDITVQHLLEHRGGWDGKITFDPMFHSREIAAALGKAGPASSQDIVRYMAGQRLQFAPGSREVYSNFGYCVLGRVIEKVSGKAYVAYVRQDLLGPLAIKSVELGRTRPGDRNPHEPHYADLDLGPSVLDPKGKELVLAPDGTFYLEAMDAHGGLIASAGDLVRFLKAYTLDGRPRTPQTSGRSVAFGSLPGTFAMALQRPDGVLIAVLFNQRRDSSGLAYERIEDAMNRAAEAVRRWP